MGQKNKEDVPSKKKVRPRWRDLRGEEKFKVGESIRRNGIAEEVGGTA